MLVKEILMVNSKAKSDKISVDKRYHQLDWRKKDTILEWAARYDIENDEQLYQSLQKMRKMGGTLAMKTFHEHVRNSVSTYNQIIQTEIDYRVENKIKINMIYVLIANILVLSLPYL